jgi:ATP-dependent DNA helicase PIF1
MCKLDGDEVEYKLKYHADLEMTPNERLIRHNCSPEQIKTELEYLKGNLRCDENIRLKIGSQVMCIVNIELTNGEMLCNGSQGIVVRFSTMDKKQPVVKFTNGFEMTMNYHVWPSENIPGVGVSQLPLILAWALTIHKAQGATLDVAEIDAGSGIFECGQTYVALSRVKSLEGLYLTSFDARKIRIHKKVQEFYQLLNAETQTTTAASTSSVVPVATLVTNNMPIAAVVTAVPIVEVQSDTQVLGEEQTVVVGRPV